MSHAFFATIALAMGCPAGIGPELLAEILATGAPDPSIRLIAIGDWRVLRQAAHSRKIEPKFHFLTKSEALPETSGVFFLDLATLDPACIPIGETSRKAGQFALETFITAIDMGASGIADAVAWMPFNKAAMRLAHPPYEDEIVFTANRLGFSGAASEFNILPRLWNARVTSHVPLRCVAQAIAFDKVLDSLRLTHAAMRQSGFDAPRIAVAGLNPHAGDDGAFGREEIDVLTPAIAAAQKDGIFCQGPLPADTVFVRAQKGEFDAVLTMYHDQGQIAMKLIGFEAGVTLLGGFPFPLVTPAHGSAYDIAYKGTAHPGAAMNAMRIAAKMAVAGKKAKRA